MRIKKNEIYCEDAFEFLAKIKNSTIDLIICDGPYGVTQQKWDKIDSIQEFNLRLIQIFSEKLKEGGALYLFGKNNCIDFIDYRPFLNLKTKIIWYQPSRLAQGRLNYTNNYDLICYFIKGSKTKCFNLDAIRVPQMVELEHRLRCEKVPSVLNGKFAKTKFNSKGKNPGDVWGDLKQLTYKSKELCNKTLHTIQKPEKLIERLVLASSNVGDLVLDPFSGVGTAPVVCQRHNRNFYATEINPEFVTITQNRLEALVRNNKPKLLNYG